MYWEDQYEALDKKLKGLKGHGLDALHEALNKYEEIRRLFSDNCVPAERYEHPVVGTTSSKRVQGLDCRTACTNGGVTSLATDVSSAGCFDLSEPSRQIQNVNGVARDGHRSTGLRRSPTSPAHVPARAGECQAALRRPIRLRPSSARSLPCQR
jgi:hypothetical protein